MTLSPSSSALYSGSHLFAGLMSGTSMDAVDVVLVDLSSEDRYRLVATHRHDYAPSLRKRLLAVNDQLDLKSIAELDTLTAHAFSQAVLELLDLANLPAEAVSALGSHGQTIFHHPSAPISNSIQIGNPALVAHLTGISVVADFRRADIAAGGEGAPLVPAFHRQFMSCRHENRAILNLGGIANVTLLPSDASAPIIGFDSGPGNCLLDGWIRQARQLDYDADGEWAQSGEISHELLERLLNHPYFSLPAPKSTGKDEFHLAWLRSECAALRTPLAPEDVQATLMELTARSVAMAITSATPVVHSTFVCGGGVNNGALVGRIGELIAPIAITSSDSLGLDPHWIEAVAFAWLAQQRLLGHAGNLPSVTGASEPMVLGALYDSAVSSAETL